MKKSLAISFLLIFLIANTAFGQLLKLPTLIHHYLEHVEWDNYSFVEFLTEHYAKEIDHPDDIHNDHQKLPLKAIDHHHGSLITTAPKCSMPSVDVFVQLKGVQNPICRQLNIVNSYLNCIWQPPRI